MKNTNRKFIGILGGTFDPPHDGHIFISRYAKLRLKVDEVWWVVTYKNPLKPKRSSYVKRLENVRKYLREKKIRILETENEKNIYAIETIKFIKEKFPAKKFIWLMGSDNIEKLHLWRNWKDIFYNIPIAIFDRPFYSLNLTKSKALSFFRKSRIRNNLSKKLKFMAPPKWTFINGLMNHQSSTSIRKNR